MTGLCCLSVIRIKTVHTTLTLASNLILLAVLLHYGLGGWQSAVYLVSAFAPSSWLILGMVLFLLLFRSDYRSDVPLFAAGLALGYWGEWWGTTRGVWTYWNGATPPDYLPPLWGIGLITVYRLSHLLKPVPVERISRPLRAGLMSSFVLLPAITIAASWPRLIAVDWSRRLDGHFLAGCIVAAFLISYRFNLGEDFSIYLCGTALGWVYEYLGTSFGEWAYITAETPPLWIAPLWGLAAVAMCRLAWLFQGAVEIGWQALFAKARGWHRRALE